MASSPESGPAPPEDSSSSPPAPADGSSSTTPSDGGAGGNGGDGSQSPPPTSDGGSDGSQPPPDSGDGGSNDGSNNGGNNGGSGGNNNDGGNNNNDGINNNDGNNNNNNNGNNNNGNDNNGNNNDNNGNNGNNNGGNNNDGGNNNNDGGNNNNNGGGGSGSPGNTNSPSTPTPAGGSSPAKHNAPPTHQLAPPKGGSSHSGGGGTDVNIPLVVGVTAGVGVFFIMLLVVFLCCGRKKKRHQEHGGHMNYYTSPSHGGSHKVDYYSSAPPPQWSSLHSMGGAGPPSGGPWHAPPPPPPMGMHSSDMSGTYSGPHGPALPPPSPNIALGFNKSTFTYDELAAATAGFSQGNLLGQGGFGYVHKGVLPNGKEVAVKSLKTGSGQGEREFQAEVEIISRVHHRHLVSLVGYCIAGGQRMLVYEFVPNGTLEHHLYNKSGPVLDFSLRVKMALGSAKGLAYLHEDCHPKIIHRDIKAANILIDYKFEAMVADFGLAKLSQDNYTHVSTRIMGTFGYLAPEYASSGKLTEKSDVFSFGVMLLELITGRRPIDTTGTMMDDCLADWAKPLMAQALADGKFDELADPRLEGNYDPTEMSRLVACANASVRHSARRRPKMSQIVRALEGDSSLEDLNDGARPGQSSAFSSSTGSSEYESGSYRSQMQHFQRVALASEEFSGEMASNEHHASTGSDTSREMRASPNPRKPL